MARAKTLSSLWRIYGLVIPILVLDSASKQWALASLFAPQRVIIITDFFRFEPVWNSGISFGLLQSTSGYAQPILAGFAVLVGVFLPLYTRHWGRLGVVGGAMMAGGAFGNALDRVIYGSVIDFISVDLGTFHWPVFNLADTAICVGAGLILWASLFRKTARTY